MDNDAIEEMFQSLGGITIRRMFGGKGIYCDGRILAIDIRDEVLFKARPPSSPPAAASGPMRARGPRRR